MKRIGLIAGGGTLPIEFVQSVKKKGDKVIVFALEGMASAQLSVDANKIYWLNIGQYKRFLFLLLKERIKKIALIGKVNKKVIYENSGQDPSARDLLKGLDNKKDYSILKEVTKHLNRVGIEVIDGLEYLSHLLPEQGILTKNTPDKKISQDIEFGYDIAKNIAKMDIGQTIVVKDKNVVAVEAMEGTDEAIKRAGRIAGENCVMIKVSRPDQDLRWDVPTIGPETISNLVDNKFKALAIESGKMYLVEKERIIDLADSNNLSVTVL